MRRLVVLLAVVLGVSTLAGIPPAAADPGVGECEALTSEQVQGPDARITGVTPADHEAYDCYVLPDGAGAVYVVNDFLETWVVATVHDADGVQICARVDRECRLVGDAPFTLRVGYEADTAYEYEVQVLRVSGANNCPHHELTGFGPGGALFDADEDDHSLVCWSVDVPRGTLMFPADTRVSLYDEQGEVLCERQGHWMEEEPYFCTTSSAGPGVVVVRTDFVSGAEIVPIVPVHRTEGCAGVIDTAWNRPPVEVPGAKWVVDCHTIAATTGARILPAVGAHELYVAYVVVDASGARACDFQSIPEPGGTLGCRLEGQPPFKMLSWSQGGSSRQPTYPIAARSLAPGVDCPTVQPMSWGAAPGDHHPGNGCRQFDAAAGQSLLLGSIEAAGGPQSMRGTYVIDDEGTLVCVGPEPTDSGGRYPYLPCDDLPAGRYFAVRDPLTSDHVTMLYDKRSSTGCTVAPPGLTLVRRPVEPGRLDCYLLGEPPRGVLGFADPIRDSEDAPLPARVLRADGTEVSGESDCLMRWCLSTADGLHRLVVGSGEQAEHEFALYTLYDLTDCVRAGPGRTDLRLTARDPFACVRIDELGNWPEIIKVRSDAGFQFAYGINGLAFCDASGLGRAGYQDLYCHANLGVYTTTFIGVLGLGGRQTVSFSRNMPQMKNRERPRIRGVPRVGRTVRARPGRWRPKPTILTYQWTLNGRSIPGATKPSLRLRRRFAGKTLKVRVTADRPQYFSRTVSSRSVVVRRR